MDRSEIEARARAEAMAREELAGREPLRAEVDELKAQAGIARRAAAALAGSRVVGLLAGYGPAGRHDLGKAGSQRRADRLRRRRFRLARAKRALEGGAGQPLRAAWGRIRPARPASGEEGAASPPRRSPGTGGPTPHRSAQPLSFCIRIAGREWEAAERGGDAALARSLARALAERGHRALVQLDREAGDPLAASLDVLLVLRGRPAGGPDPSRLSLIWQISHPDEANAEELNRYDRVLVSSARQAETLAATLTAPVEALPQFTDPELFHPTPPSEPRHDLLFVGNWRGEFRPIAWDAIEAGRPPALYGQGWDLLAPEHAVAEHVPHADLHRLYSSCAILLVDHWDDMRRLGFVSNKVLDALACGAFVIADDNPGLAELLPDGVETYSTAEELREKIDRYLADPAARERIAARGREIVLAGHTVEHRAEQLITIARGAAAGGASAAAAAPPGAGEATA